MTDKPKKPMLDPRLRQWGIKIPYLRFTFTHPTPEEIRKLRVDSGLTQVQAAKSVGLSSNIRWAEYENGTSRPDVARWTLFQLIVRCHPEWKLRRNKDNMIVQPPKPRRERKQTP